MRPNNPGSAAIQRLRGLVGLASASSQKGEFARAEQFFREALKERPSDAYLLSRLMGLIYQRQRDYLRATHHLQEALRICPNHRRSLDALESVLSAAGSSNPH
jgi:tetratricopeptide (TPR) repeat protein